MYAPRCRSRSRGTPWRREWRSCETASGMSSLRPAGSCSSGPSDANRSTAGSGAVRPGRSRAGERRGCGPWPREGRGGPPSMGRAGGGLQHGGRGGLGGHGGLPARRGRHCDASAAGCHSNAQGCGGGMGTCPTGAGCTVAGARVLVLLPTPRSPCGPLAPPGHAGGGASVLVLLNGFCGRGSPCPGRGPMGWRTASWTPPTRLPSLGRCGVGSTSCPCRSQRA